jgi:hypothetical protein
LVSAWPRSKNYPPLRRNILFGLFPLFLRNRVDQDLPVLRDLDLASAALLRRPDSAGDVGLCDASRRSAHD